MCDQSTMLVTPALSALQGAPEDSGVDVVGLVMRRKAGDHCPEVAPERGLAGGAADRALADVPVRVDEPGHHDLAGCVDDPRVGWGVQVGADLLDDAVADADVGAREVSGVGSMVTTWPFLMRRFCGMRFPFAGWWIRLRGSAAARNRVVGAEELLRVVLRLDRLESPVGVGRVEPRRVGRPLGEVEVLPAGVVRGKDVRQ